MSQKITNEYIRKNYTLQAPPNVGFDEPNLIQALYDKTELINLNRDTPLKKYKSKKDERPYWHIRGIRYYYEELNKILIEELMERCFECDIVFNEDDDIYSGAIFGVLENLCEDCFEKGELECKIIQCLGCDKNLGDNEEQFDAAIYGKIYCKDCFKKEVLDAEDSSGKLCVY